MENVPTITELILSLKTYESIHFHRTSDGRLQITFRNSTRYVQQDITNTLIMYTNAPTHLINETAHNLRKRFYESKPSQPVQAS